MDISIVIVNYNVKYFLDLAIKSAIEATKNLKAEIFIVDNNSSDDSVAFIEKYYPKEEYPSISLLVNKENTGFSKANNQAIRLSKGKYILLLNPDTILAEDTLEKCISFMNKTPDAGALGVRMIDGKGLFLPESKRGLPSPKVSLYKMSGLAKLFPKSREFGKYHLSYLDENCTNEVDVLSGAFMFMRKHAIDKVGMLDETFFMYGEDIDLSYRITQGGYKNYYLPETTIIHFKGESTKKQSAHYVKIFYGAMQIFVKKHFAGAGAGLVAFFLSLAINLRAGFALVYRFIKAIALPLLDFTTIYLGFYFIAKYWEHYNKWVKAIYPKEYYLWHIPIYIIILLLFILLSGGYKKPVSAKKILRGTVAGGIILLSIYGLVSKDFQFSRAIVGLGIAWTGIGIILIRIIIQFIKYGNIDLGSTEKKKTVLVGEQNAINDYLNHSEKSFQNVPIIGIITDQNTTVKQNVLHLGSIPNMKEIVNIYGLNELKICTQNLSFKTVINLFNVQQKQENISFKLINQEKQYLVGSDSKNKTGTLWSFEEIPSFFSTEVQESKRIQDILVCLTIPLLIPIILLKGKWTFFTNYFKVLGNKKTWVAPLKTNYLHFPTTKEGVFSPSSLLNEKSNNIKNESNLELEYLLHYDSMKDLNILWFNLVH